RHHFIPQSTPSRGHDPDLAADCPRLSNPHSSIAPRRSTHAAPRFPPSRLFGRLPPCIPSRLRLAGIRQPLTIPDLSALAPNEGLAGDEIINKPPRGCAVIQRCGGIVGDHAITRSAASARQRGPGWSKNRRGRFAICGIRPKLLLNPIFRTRPC